MATTRKGKRTARAANGTKTSGDGEAPTAASRRTHEAFGIVLLACALLVGPSLVSVQFGHGDLMGPFGQLLGTLLHWTLGLSGHLVVLALIAVSGRIFAGAVGRLRRQPTATVWRRRAGFVLLLLLGSMLAHLIAYPARLARSSYGGAVGEYIAEVLSSLLSRPGTWLIVIAGLAVSLVVTTNFSWARSAVHVGAAVRLILTQLTQALGRVPGRLQGLGSWLAAQLAYVNRRQQVQSSSSGEAALPPVLRVDMSAAGPNKSDRSASSAKGRRRARAAASCKDQADDVPALAASLLGEPAPLLDDAAHGLPSQQNARQAMGPETAAAPKLSDSHVEPPSKPHEAKQTLTIVQSNFRTRTQALEDDSSWSAEATPANDSETAGFVLNHDTYRAPPLGLLEIHGEQQHAIDEAAIQAQAARLTQTLSDYKIFGEVTEVHPGPVVTMYEFVPAPGTRVSKVASLSDDLAMSLHAERVRIVAPIPGKGAIGIEVPNAEREVVSFKEIVADDAFRQRKGKLKLALGKSIVGAPVVMDLSKMPHLLVAGATGAGKSVSVNSMICSLLMRYTPEEVRLILIDPKFLELSGYNDIPHLLLPVVTDPKQAAVALRWAVAEMERRYQLLADMRVRDITTFNRKVDRMHAGPLAEEDAESATGIPSNESLTEARPAQITRLSSTGEVEVSDVETDDGDSGDGVLEPGTSIETAAITPPKRIKRKPPGDTPSRLPYLVVVIDEFADLMMVASKEVETSVARLAQKARACGIHLIVATQRPSVDVITGLIKANFPSRIAFQVASNHDSKTILGTYGAENLLGAGDMLVLDRGAEMKRVHGAYISDDEIRRIIEWLCEQGRPVYDMEILRDEEEDETQEGPRSDEPADPLYDEAVSIVADTRQASISMVQRRLRIGYNRAARLIEQMEREGIVGPPDGVRGREVLVQNHG